ncbi:MAG: sugar phosphate isomerase/epimerase [Bryobacterales bacterium]|nr:sugar phosphate isomerase/epimerase [Bryobacterales bacterium]
MTRRQLMAAAGSAAAIFPKAVAQSNSRGLGGSPTAFLHRVRAAREAKQEFDILEHCHKLGLSGTETFRPPATPEAIKSYRRKAEGYGLRVVFNVPLPKTSVDVAAFDNGVKAAKEAGGIAIHAAMTARRYEEFDTFAAFKQNFELCQRMVELAEPVLRKHRMRLAIENHKGWRSPEHAAWIKRLGSEWVGVCLDFGNNLSLCETPEQTFENLAPYTVFCHIKDMGLESYRDGFLLSEVPFGHGVTNLGQMVQNLRKRDPNMLFCLEMITRDPLKIPVFTDRYWATFDDSHSPLPARDLARVLRLVRDNPPKTPLPRVDGLSAAAQIKAEDAYNRQCIDYARRHLDL